MLIRFYFLWIPPAPSVGVYRQACLRIPLAVGFVGRDRRLWNLMVQGTRRFRQVRAASCVIPYVLCGCLYCLRCWCVLRGGLCPPLYIQGDRVTWKVLAEYIWSPTTTQSGSFLCTVASSTPIRVVTREIRHIYELSLTLEHSMPISSPATLGLTVYAVGFVWPVSAKPSTCASLKPTQKNRQEEMKFTFDVSKC